MGVLELCCFDVKYLIFYLTSDLSEDITQRFYINTRRLITEEETRKEYAAKLDERIEGSESWEEVSEACQKTAEEVLGLMKEENPRHVKDQNISKMSTDQKDIRMKMMKEKDQGKLQVLREKRKKILKTIFGTVIRYRRSLNQAENAAWTTYTGSSQTL